MTLRTTLVALAMAMALAQVGPSHARQTRQDQARSAAWRRASPDRVVRVPADHVAHPEYRIEWWYYTGNVMGDDGKPYGYQVTFFRVGVDKQPVNPSRFAVRDLHMAHVAVTDIANARHRFADRLNRAGVHWAGASSSAFQVWNENWRAELDAQGRHRLSVQTPAFALDLTLDAGRPAVLQGVNGYSRKGDDPGNASHYYSLTRMPTTGRVRIEGRTVPVRGESWMDHEFGTSALDASTRGWDWFALHLEDGRDLMLYQLRRDNGAAGRWSSGTLVHRDGSTEHLAASDFVATPGRTWRSPQSGARYPVEWQLRVPRARLDLRVSAAVDAQELRTRRSTNVTYWEGSVRVSGTSGGSAASGRGYLEMTGYAGATMSDVMR